MYHHTPIKKHAIVRIWMEKIHILHSCPIWMTPQPMAQDGPGPAGPPPGPLTSRVASSADPKASPFQSSCPALHSQHPPAGRPWGTLGLHQKNGKNGKNGKKHGKKHGKIMGYESILLGEMANAWSLPTRPFLITTGIITFSVDPP